MSEFFLPPFSKDTANKIGNGINVSGKNTLMKTDEKFYRVAISDEPIDGKVDGKKLFCVRVDNAGSNSMMMIGFTLMETFDSNNSAYFGRNGFSGAGVGLYSGKIYYPDNKHHNIIDQQIAPKAKEVIVILTISNSGKKKVIRFIVDGVESKTKDVSKYLNGDSCFPAICLSRIDQQITTIPIDEIKTRTPEIDEHQRQRAVKQARSDLLKQNEQMMYDFFKQFEQQTNASDVVEVETKKENTKEKKTKQIATKKTKKETKPKTTKATKKKEEKNNNIIGKKPKSKK
jgi:hypothetical protein